MRGWLRDIVAGTPDELGGCFNFFPALSRKIETPLTRNLSPLIQNVRIFLWQPRRQVEPEGAE